MSLHDTSNPPAHAPPQKPHHRTQTGLYSVSGGQVNVWAGRRPPAVHNTACFWKRWRRQNVIAAVWWVWTLICMLTQGLLPHRCGYLLYPDKQTFFPLAVCWGQLVRHQQGGASTEVLFSEQRKRCPFVLRRAWIPSQHTTPRICFSKSV